MNVVLNAKSRILVVEDEIIVARDIQQQLLVLGYDPVGHASRGEDAIILAEQLHPDLILMDIQLAGAIDGIAAAQAIRNKLFLPVVFLTAFAADDVLSRAKLTEPYGYILKPFSERELRTVLEMALYKHKAEVKLRETAQHTQAILDNMADAVITVNQQGLIESFNQAASVIFGYSASDAVGRLLITLLPKSDRSNHDDYLQNNQDGSEKNLIDQACVGQRKNGESFPMNLSITRITQLGLITFIYLIRDNTQRHKDEEKIRLLAGYDALTGLPNRRLLIDRLQQAKANASRHRQFGAILFLDLDDFKHVNDMFDHSLGDELLMQVAARIGACSRDSDFVAHLGGDEFVLLMETLGSDAREAASKAEIHANTILSTLKEAYILGTHVYVNTASIGITLFDHHLDAVETLLKNADLAMFQAKAAGRNTVQFFDPAMQAVAAARSEMEEDMRQGMVSNQFVLHYQIQVKRESSGAMITTGVEALIRWQCPKRGMVSPAHFIPLAEATGMILPLGQWVLETACEQLVAWSQNPLTAEWTIAVNVSAFQFAQIDFVATVDKALQKTGANPQRLKLELTESMLATNVDDLILKMNAILAHGVGFSLDDFGTGYSSLSYLKRLPLAQLKIDQSFVRDLLTDPNDAVIARTIIALGHSIGLKVIAEGVETIDQCEFLTSIGCDAFQGYYFGRPCPAHVLIEAHRMTIQAMNS